MSRWRAGVQIDFGRFVLLMVLGGCTLSGRPNRIVTRTLHTIVWVAKDDGDTKWMPDFPIRTSCDKSLKTRLCCGEKKNDGGSFFLQFGPPSSTPSRMGSGGSKEVAFSAAGAAPGAAAQVAAAADEAARRVAAAEAEIREACVGGSGSRFALLELSEKIAGELSLGRCFVRSCCVSACGRGADRSRSALTQRRLFLSLVPPSPARTRALFQLHCL
jgi:hypothetical protein